MFERIRRAISWLNELRGYVESRYPSESPVVTPAPDRRSKLRRWWDLNRRRLLRDAIAVVLALVCVAILSEYVLIWKIMSETQFMTRDELGFLLASDLFLSGRIEMPIYVSLGVVVVLCILLFWSRSVSVGWLAVRMTVVLICGYLNSQYGTFEDILVRHQSATAYRLAMSEFRARQYPIAERLFLRILQSRLEPALDDEIKGWLIGIDYWEGDHLTATEAACRFVGQHRDSEIVDEIRTTLHWSIYGLGHSIAFEEAIAELDRIRTQYGLICHREASPYWLAISPDVYWRAIGTLSTEWPYRLPEGLSFSDRYPASLSVRCARVAHFCEDLETFHEDFATLARIVETYPDEPGQDIALYILGQWDDIISSHPNSRILDATLMAAGLHHERAGHCDRAAYYFREFLERFPHHRWRAEARLHMGRCLTTQGDLEQATLEYARLIKEFRADVSEQINVERAEKAIEEWVRERLDSATLRLLIRANPTEEAITELNYWLAVRLFHERAFADARALFQEVQHDTPTSQVGYAARQHIQTIDSLRPILKAQSAEFLFDMARWYIAQVAPAAPEETPVISGLSFFKATVDIPASLLNSRLGSAIDTYPLAHDRQAMSMAVQYLDEFAESFPDDARIADVLLGQGGVYEALAYGATGDDSLHLRDKSTQAYKRYLELFPESNAANVEKAITKMALIYLNKGGWLNDHDLQLMRENGRWLVERFPNHHLANNILNWIAWTYCRQANMYPFDSPEYKTYYIKAAETYEEILRDYPYGDIAANAKSSLEIIERKLADPNERKPVPMWRWYWSAVDCSYMLTSGERFEMICLGDPSPPLGPEPQMNQ